MKNLKKEFIVAFKISIPVLMGYLVLGFAFGLLLTSYGYSWYLAPLMAIFIYAGALQFVAIQFFNLKAGYLDIALASWFVNLRQSFYGLSLLKRFKNTGVIKSYLIHALTDETYALLTTVKDKKMLNLKYYYLFLAGLNQVYWIIGCTAGALLGANIHFNTSGLEFSLTALFVVLCVEQYKKLKRYTPFLIGIFAAIVSLLFVPSDKMLIVSITVALVCMFMFRKVLEK